MRLPLITQHAIERAQQPDRWGLGSPAEAEAAIKYVLKHGRWSGWPHRKGQVIQNGTRCVVVVENRVVTAYIVPKSLKKKKRGGPGDTIRL
ncbi:hypothetical protein [Deinococcus enclensis]|uniref:DUF4258 domain-containing protein n=1 Tax=Deinococcus enclensis TaxID=1049582 RepID=A0ABT9MEF6_9DEIO|nr:hypothetical protein [Deinococcus enclensis]MDP9764889.1 hypothetical protein [Deinococcus enclensis]